MGNKWTPEQQKAIDTRGGNLLVAAAAGSGKTAVLVERIIKIITSEENPVDIDRLLVVTFTNAAAAEMRERIGDAISRELDVHPNSKVLQRQLTLLNRSNITTMHSFCLDVIKNNFHHIDLDPNFRISDDTEAVLLKQEVLQDLMEDKYEDGEESFLRLVECFGGSKDDAPLTELINSLYSFSMSGPWPHRWLKEKAEEFKEAESLDITSTPWGKLLLESIKIDVFSSGENIAEGIKLAEDSPGLEPYLETLRGDMIIIENLIASLGGGFEAAYEAFRNSDFATIKRAKKDADKDVQEQVKKLRDEAKDKIKSIRGEIFNVSPERALEAISFMYPVMKALSDIVIEFDERYSSKKRDRGILDFNDLEHFCLSILSEEVEEQIKPSSVALVLRDKFEEVLVDEYQDSNNVQETIINMVSRKFEANPNVFMVGDVKQSIYRFRQAKPELFLDKYNNYKEEGTNQKILLFKNFRSRLEVINGVNYVFKQLMSETVGELDYTDREALNQGAVFEEPEEGSVVGGALELHILDRSGSEEEEKEEEDTEEIIPELDMPMDEQELDNVQLEARLVAKRIKELMNSDEEGRVFQVYDKEIKQYRKVMYKDIVILMRATSNWAPVFTEELNIEGIPVYADSNSGYFQTVEIRTMMSLLQIIDNPYQDVPMLAVLRSPIFGFTPEELIDVRLIAKGRYIYENIRALVEEEPEISVSLLDRIKIHKENLKEKSIYFIECINRWRDKHIHMPLDEFIWYIYTDTSYYGYVGAMANGLQRQANLKILFQRAKQYEATSFRGLFNFINFINRLRSSSGDFGSAKILGENEDVVRIMSIHKSKGLEFPVVILAGTGKQFNLMDLNRRILFHEELGYGPDYVDYEKRLTFPTIKKIAMKKKFKLENLSEEMRILYVAFTRAKEKLIITGSVGNIEASVKRWCSLASSDSLKVPDYQVLKGKSFLDWIATAVVRHRDGEAIRKAAEKYVAAVEDASCWEVKLWSKKDVLVDKKNEAVEESLEAGDNLFEESLESRYEKEIERRLSFKYKYIDASKISANVSVSELKRAAMEDLEDGMVVSLYKTQEVKKPDFLKEEKGLSPSERGTITHFVMQHVDLSKIQSSEEIHQQIRLMVEKAFITEKEASAVNPYKIYKFFKSDLGIRMLKAYEDGRTLRREVPFYVEIPATTVNESLPKEIYDKEMVRLQGVIDCYFEEEDGIVLLDYKTDYVGEDGTEPIKERYTVQIKYYSETLEKITGKKIKDKYLYLFYNDQAIDMEE
ncbi:helicase-exonuclease AddAB subunit AddA [Clostridium sp. 19966]|uniref:helicase-exonuclease AddAB subunit AddA n=1 Tax=Clostridium sp. 19966 TaxID=2768166 RepID=UPI0028DFF95B|nr:helicase-exonuclease AddAB subunit AddA [Clostridium sp. 19966]MDT8718867.1 helicase-exonuclease AddAB subunit AddA [Clostridium sp. 19966]